MFGYVRPFKPELKIRDFELYRAAYCGLCHSLGRNFGLLSRMALSYDMTLAVLVSSPPGAETCRKACAAHPFKKRLCVAEGAACASAAALSVILAYHKAGDAVRDKGLFKKAGGLAARLALRRKYKKAAAQFRGFDELCAEKLSALAALEKSGCAEVDAVADCFASLLSGLSLLGKTEAERRIFDRLFYHVGRAVYIIDAADDLKDDVKREQYNALALRFPSFGSGEREWVAETVEHSLAAAAAAFELLPKTEFTPAAENILYLGLPASLREALHGQGAHGQTKARPADEPI